MLEMDAVQESVVYRSDAWFGKGEQWEREKFLVLLDGEEVEIPLEVLKFRENLKFLARKKLEI